MRKIPVKMKACVALCLALFVPPLAAEETTPLTSNQADAILKELQEIRGLLEKIEKQQRFEPVKKRKLAPKTASISSAGRPAMGSPDAPLTLIEFTDYQCPFCSRFARFTLPELKKQYIDTGKLRLVVKDLSRDFHAQSRKAAQAAHCAGEQDKYWAMHDMLFKNQKQLKQENWLEYAREISLDVEAFEKCIGSERHLKEIDKDTSDASAATITNTPSFVLGQTTDDFIEGPIIRGAKGIRDFRIRIDSMLTTIK